ncbi:hypothetical protein AVEN_156978-1 [Araneus ventricosus]|uniref:Uncharacterized protein n=1 Tax=Araneus ventricosus TaxID=182803 RepID=A0A4Y2HKQ0_ARAVE|nr:hypothetical protein AVEN_156978-1 [Araneus ventricosus]
MTCDADCTGTKMTKYDMRSRPYGHVNAERIICDAYHTARKCQSMTCDADCTGTKMIKYDMRRRPYGYENAKTLNPMGEPVDVGHDHGTRLIVDFRRYSALSRPSYGIDSLLPISYSS